MIDVVDMEVQDRVDAAQMQYAAALSMGVCGQDAFLRVAGLVGRLATIDPAELIRAGAGRSRHNPYARQHMRMLCTIVGPQVPDDELPEAVRSIVCNPALPLALVRDVVEGGDGTGQETSGATLRRIAQALRAGWFQRDVAEKLGVDRHVVGRVSVFLDIPEAIEARLQSAALRWVIHEQGGYRDFMAQEGVGKHVALRLLQGARATVADLRGDGVLAELGLA